MISEELRAQLLQQLEADQDISESELVSLLNQTLENDEFVLSSNLEDNISGVSSFFQQFEPSDIIKNRRQIITQGVWSKGKGTLTFDDMYLFSDQVNSESGLYFYEVYDSDPTIDLEASRIQYYVAYGNQTGGGSQEITTSDVQALESTKAVYFQHKNVLSDSTQIRDSFFTTENLFISNPSGGGSGSGVNGDIDVPGSSDGKEDFYVINLSRARYKQKFDPGNWEIRLVFAEENSSGNPETLSSGSYSGPGSGYDLSDLLNYSVVSLVDEAAESDFNNSQLNIGDVGREYNVYSGSLNFDNSITTVPDVIQPEDYSEVSGGIPAKPYGKFYPDLGVILLNPNMLCRHALFINESGPQRNFNSTLGEYDGYVDTTTNSLNKVDLQANSTYEKSIKRFLSISPKRDKDGNYENPEKIYNAIKRGGYFTGRSAEEVVSTHLFVRVRNTDFNFSNNPSFTNSDGTLAVEEFEGDPKTFITSVGLYDDENNLVAVAKLSKPTQKSFQEEKLIKIRLDF